MCAAPQRFSPSKGKARIPRKINLRAAIDRARRKWWVESGEQAKAEKMLFEALTKTCEFKDERGLKCRRLHGHAGAHKV